MVNLKLKSPWMYGGRLEASFHVVVGQAVYKECRRCIQSSGIELSGLTLEPLAFRMQF
jgi:cell division protein FtsA